MSDYAKPIDVTTSRDLERLADQVKTTRVPVPLIQDGEIVAVVQPAPKRKRRVPKVPSAADIAATRSSAGSWADMDTDALIEHGYRARAEGSRPATRPEDRTD